MLKIICVGQIKEKSISSLIEEYLKRISKYAKMQIIELEDFGYNTKESMKKEADLILSHLITKDFVITLEIEGKEINSLEFAEFIRVTQISNANIVFVIGGSNGLDESVKKRSNQRISFSKLTFPHQLFRVILLEQIYRSFKINNNEAYHK